MVVAAVVTLAVAEGTAVAAPASRPSELGCLRAWNAQSNGAGHARLLAARPFRGLSLGAGAVATVTWTKGSRTGQTRAEACLLTVVKVGRTRVVVGRWRAGLVRTWSWGRWLPVSRPAPANVSLLPDGRLKKVYRH